VFSFKFDYDHDYGHVRPVKTVSKGKLKAKMLEYFREVEATGEPLIVTDHGCEVLEVRPVKRSSTTEEVLAEYAAGGPSKLPLPEELMEPLPAEEWEALREDNR
jgi:antitoxin (DNA-binding transcriptional repressor) of toxin-antitoxin stability system